MLLNAAAFAPLHAAPSSDSATTDSATNAASASSAAALPGAKPQPIPTVDAKEYRATLQDAQGQLKRMEAGKARAGLGKLLQALSKPDRLRVRRSDGTTQLAGSDQWARLAVDLQNSSATSRSAPTKRVDVTQARRAVEERLRALDEWMTPRDGAFYQAAQAQKIVRDLERTQQIRTGPTPLQAWWANFKASFARFIDRLGKAIFGVRNSVKPSGKRKLDDRWVQFFFYSTVLSLLGVVGWLLYRHLGGRLGREGARRDVRFVGGEDAELLVLPQGELRTRAESFADEGNFREAVRHRFIALLLHLDERGVWRYDSRRTNWEHIGALRRAQSPHMSTHVAPDRGVLIEPLSNLTRRFDRVRYGNAQASSDDWKAFDRDAASLEEAANRPGAPASSTASSAVGAST